MPLLDALAGTSAREFIGDFCWRRARKEDVGVSDCAGEHEINKLLETEGFFDELMSMLYINY